MVYPLFHVVRFLSAMGGKARLSLLALENGIVGVACKEAQTIRLVLANLGASASRIPLPRRGEVRILNARAFPAAIHDPCWLDAGEPEPVAEVALEPFDVAFVEMPL